MDAKMVEKIAKSALANFLLADAQVNYDGVQ
jgi:hypothetical protein